MRNRIFHRAGIVLAVITLAAPSVTSAAEAATGQDNAIEGTVRAAEQRQRIEGARVVLEGGGISREAVTGADGRFTFASVPPGEYQITASIIGRRAGTFDVTVIAGETARLDIGLDPEPVTLDELVVTGTIMPTAVREVPTPVTIVSRADIERLAPRNIAELVRTAVPGAVYTDEGPGARYGVFSVRGVSGLGAASTLKVYVDGAEVADPAYVTNLDPGIIERVEVVSGPQASTIYGSRAISGVMQIFTRRGSGGDWRRPRLSGKMELEVVESPYVSGTPRAPEYRLTLAGGDSRFGYNLGYSGRQEPEWVDLLTQEDQRLFGSVNFTVGRLEAQASMRAHDGSNYSSWNPILREVYREVGAPDNPPTRQRFISRLETNSLDLGFEAASWWHHDFTVGFDRYEDSYYPVLPNDNGTYSVRARDTNRSSMAYNTTISRALTADMNGTFVFGADRSEYSLTAHDPIEVSDWRDYDWPTADFTRETRSDGYFGQMQLGFRDAVFFTGGIRGDRHPEGSTDGLTWSPRFGITGIRQAGEFTIKPRFAWGQAVIVPDERQVGGDENEFSILLANPDLRAQKQRGYDLGVDVHYGGKGSIGLTFFDQDPVDLIELVLTGSDTSGPFPRNIFQYQNLHRMNNQGWELKVEAQPTSRLSLNVNYGLTNSTVAELDESYTGDYEEGQTLDERPKWTLSAGTSLIAREGTTVNADLTYLSGWNSADFAGFLGDIYSGNFNPVAKPYPLGYHIDYPGFMRLNLGVSQDLPGGASAFVHIFNLTDDENFERINTAAPRPRTWTIGVRF